MIHSKKISILFLIGVLNSLLVFQVAFSQTYVLNDQTSFLEVHGTSSLHDWHVDAERQSGKVEISNLDDLKINVLSFSVVSESLKSGKSGMDKNTYKALKTDKHKTIDFNLTSVKSKELISDNHYKVLITGNMTICGVTKSVNIELTVKLVGNNLLLEGEKSLLMTDYGIAPPKALLGTIKTGDEIKIIFKTVFENKN
jgi:polyisoprenoid-binding protein YceI